MSTPSQNLDGDPFGFDRSAAKDKLRKIRPSVPAPVTSDMAKVDAAAEAVGFVSRENSARPIPEYPPHYGVANAPARRPTLAINMRLPENIAAVFQRFDELYKEGRMEEVFASVYGAEMGAKMESAASEPAEEKEIGAP